MATAKPIAAAMFMLRRRRTQRCIGNSAPNYKIQSLHESSCRVISTSCSASSSSSSSEPGGGSPRPVPAGSPHQDRSSPPLPTTTTTSTTTVPPRPPLPRGAFLSTPRRPTQSRTAEPLNIWSAIKIVFGWKPEAAPTAASVPAPFNAINNPYRARKQWPPDFTTLHPKHQFRYEKTYRRRLKLKYARPGWIKGTKVVQTVITVMVVGYWVFFLEVDGEEGTTPFDAFRAWSFNALKNTANLPEETRREMDRLSQPNIKQKPSPSE